MEEKIKTEEFQKIMSDVLEAYEKLQNKKYLDKYIENKFKYYPNIKNNKSEIIQAIKDSIKEVNND